MNTIESPDGAHVGAIAIFSPCDQVASEPRRSVPPPYVPWTPKMPGMPLRASFFATATLPATAFNLAVLRGLVRDFAARQATLAELRQRFEAAAPEAELARFFADWLDRPGAPVVECEWSAQGALVRVTLRQVQRGAPYRLELELALDSPAGRSLHTLTLDGRETSVELPCDAVPTGVELDPRHRLLLWTPEYGPRPEQ